MAYNQELALILTIPHSRLGTVEGTDSPTCAPRTGNRTYCKFPTEWAESSSKWELDLVLHIVSVWLTWGKSTSKTKAGCKTVAQKAKTKNGTPHESPIQDLPLIQADRAPTLNEKFLGIAPINKMREGGGQPPAERNVPRWSASWNL